MDPRGRFAVEVGPVEPLACGIQPTAKSWIVVLEPDGTYEVLFEAGSRGLSASLVTRETEAVFNLELDYSGVICNFTLTIQPGDTDLMASGEIRTSNGCATPAKLEGTWMPAPLT